MTDQTLQGHLSTFYSKYDISHCNIHRYSLCSHLRIETNQDNSLNHFEHQTNNVKESIHLFLVVVIQQIEKDIYSIRIQGTFHSL